MKYTSTSIPSSMHCRRVLQNLILKLTSLYWKIWALYSWSSEYALWETVSRRVHSLSTDQKGDSPASVGAACIAFYYLISPVDAVELDGIAKLFLLIPNFFVRHSHVCRGTKYKKKTVHAQIKCKICARSGAAGDAKTQNSRYWTVEEAAER